MRTLVVQRALTAPADYIFDAISEGDRLARLPGVRAVEVLRAGTGDRCGAGARRRVCLMPLIWLEEEITVAERPLRWEYQLLRTQPSGFRHHGGSIRLQPVPEGTVVTWTTCFSIVVPVAGALLEGWAERGADLTLHAVLRAIDRQYLETYSEAW